MYVTNMITQHRVFVELPYYKISFKSKLFNTSFGQHLFNNTHFIVHASLGIQ